MIGQHQAQAGQMHHIRIGQPVALAELCAQGQQALRKAGSALAPKLCGDG
jgi:hypothetical protein